MIDFEDGIPDGYAENLARRQAWLDKRAADELKALELTRLRAHQTVNRK